MCLDKALTYVGPSDVPVWVCACVFMWGWEIKRDRRKKACDWWEERVFITECVCTCLYLCVFVAAGWWANITKSTLSQTHCFTCVCVGGGAGQRAAALPLLLQGISMTQGDDLWHLMVHTLLSHKPNTRSGETQVCVFLENTASVCWEEGWIQTQLVGNHASLSTFKLWANWTHKVAL